MENPLFFYIYMLRTTTRHAAQTVTLSRIIMRNRLKILTSAPVLFPEKSAGRRKAAGPNHCLATFNFFLFSFF